MKYSGRSLLVLVLFGMLAVHSHASDLKPFTSDGCSSFPDGPPTEPDKWKDCCLEHDKAYWLGGTYDDRRAADQALQDCITEVENSHLADLMWAGVRAGGSPYWPTSFRWSYGWPYTRGYRALTEEERQQAELLLKSHRHE